MFDPDANRNQFHAISFFPLNGKGFGNDGAIGDASGYNYAFTMILSNSFIYQGGEELFVNGDDDIWVFVDKKLVLDLGGLHVASCCHVSFDSLGLVPGDRYRFDLFFAERHSVGSSLNIITDLQFAGPIIDTKDTMSLDSTSLVSGNDSDDNEGGLCGNGAVLALIPLFITGIFGWKRK
jgi:fibro-slime domain-containing protein